jgi:uroporphyrinogen-III synthase
VTVRLLVTRPQPEAERTGAILRARGHAVVVAPLLRIEPVAGADIGAGPWAAILVTSVNAASAIASHERVAALRAVPVFAVGERSAEAMRKVGFAAVTSTDGALPDLVRLVTERVSPGASLLYLAGAERSGDLAGDLLANGFVAHTVVIYRAVTATAFPASAADAVASGIGGVLHYSRRSAEAYVNAARASGQLAAAVTEPVHFCLSAQVAEPLRQAGVVDIRIAPQPTESALVALIPAA